MNKKKLVEYVSAASNITKKDAEEMVTSVLQGIIQGVAEDDEVTIVGFGSFKRKHREERKGRNPQTQEEILIPASDTVKFKPGIIFRNSL